MAARLLSHREAQRGRDKRVGPREENRCSDTPGRRLSVTTKFLQPLNVHQLGCSNDLTERILIGALLKMHTACLASF